MTKSGLYGMANLKEKGRIRIFLNSLLFTPIKESFLAFSISYDLQACDICSNLWFGSLLKLI